MAGELRQRRRLFRAEEAPKGDMPGPGSRSLILGPTGAGKTELALLILQRWKDAPIVVYDLKEEPRFADLPRSRRFSSWEAMHEASYDEAIDYLIFRPPASEMHDPAALDDYFLAHYEGMGRIAAYIDEMHHVASGPPRPGLTALLTRGRGRGIATIMASQRPAWITSFAYSETQLFMVFRLTMRGDVARVAEFIPDFEELPPAPRFSFWRWQVGSEQAPELVSFERFQPREHEPPSGAHGPEPAVDEERGTERVWL